MLITKKYALMVKNTQDAPMLIKLDFNTITLQYLTYPRVDSWSPLAPAFLGDLKNGDIGYVQGGYHLFIIDNQTLKIKQDKPQNSGVEGILGFSSVLDES